MSRALSCALPSRVGDSPCRFDLTRESVVRLRFVLLARSRDAHNLASKAERLGDPARLDRNRARFASGVGGRTWEAYPVATMGAWGEKAFENDSALDWLAEFEGRGLAMLRETLSNVASFHADEYLDVDDGAPAIAAAEIVAAALRRQRDRVPKELSTWLDAHEIRRWLARVVSARSVAELLEE